MIEDEGLRRQLRAIVEKSNRALAAAKDHFEKGDYDFASSKAYYAVFHVMQGALLTKGLAFSKHSGVVSAFNQHFVKTGIFPKEFSKNIQRLFKERQIGDYEYESTIDEEEARKDIDIAEEIVRAVEGHLLPPHSRRRSKKNPGRNESQHE